MDASLRQQDSRYAVCFERPLAHAPEKVWRALTEGALLKLWFPCEVHGEWKPGARLRFVFETGEAEGLDDEDLSGEVIHADPPRLLEYSWGRSLLRWELIPTAGGCTLRFSDTVHEPSIAARNAAGWELCLANLTAALADETPAPFAMDAWRAPFQRYVAAFEPVAGAQQGPPEKHPAVVAEREQAERERAARS